MFKKRSIALIIGTTLATAYAIYLTLYFIGTTNVGSASEQIGGAIATVLVTPHMICVWIGVIFGWLGFIMIKPWAILTSDILYAVGAILFLMYAVFLLPSIILGFVGYGVTKKKITTKQESTNYADLSE